MRYIGPVTTPAFEERELAQDLLRFIDAAPSPFHAVAEARRRLEAAGFTPLAEGEAWDLEAGGRYLVERGDGALAAFRVGAKPPGETGFRIVGAHTDSPGLRLKPHLAVARQGHLSLDVEVYGGPILATWADRDLSLAGRIYVEEDGALRPRLVRLERPVCRIPNVAIHLDRKVNDEGLSLDKHRDLAPVAGLWSGDGDPGRAVLEAVAGAAGVDPDAVRGHDLGLYDLQPSTFAGLDDELVFAPRLDNEAMSHAGLRALQGAEAADATAVLVLFDHEEVGSGTHRGAAGPFLKDLLGRLVEAFPQPGGLPRALARSLIVSADMAHAVHPNRPDLHDGSHVPRLNGGPVIKTNANQRYATDAETGAAFRRLCRLAGVPVQEFVMRADLPCGSTIGPLSAAGLGVRVVDVGNPMLSMHSIRELGGSRDAALMTRVLAAFLSDR